MRLTNTQFEQKAYVKVLLKHTFFAKKSQLSLPHKNSLSKLQEQSLLFKIENNDSCNILDELKFNNFQFETCLNRYLDYL